MGQSITHQLRAKASVLAQFRSWRGFRNSPNPPLTPDFPNPSITHQLPVNQKIVMSTKGRRRLGFFFPFSFLYLAFLKLTALK